MPKPNQLPKLNFEGISPTHQQFMNQLTDTVNTLAGYNGTIELSDHLSLGGKRITNVGPPVLPTDALSSGVADNNYSASALRPQLESNGSRPMVSMRRLNDGNQREQKSSWLNDIPSTVPNANSINPILANVTGGVSISIPASSYTFADGSSTSLYGYYHVVHVPSTYTISTISCTGNVVTVVLTTTPTLFAGDAVNVAGVTPSSFNGVFVLTSVVGATIQYQLSLGSVSGSGGTVEDNGVYYLCVAKRSNTISIIEVSADTAQNRLQANLDGLQIVAVVVVTSSGGQVSQSGGGGSAITGSPTAGAFF